MAARNKSQTAQIAASAARVAVRAEASIIANRAARAAVREFVKSPEHKHAMESLLAASMDKYGIDVGDDDAIRAFKSDMAHIRTWREFWEFTQKKGITATVNWIVAASLLSLVTGIGFLIKRNFF